ncbi:MAG: AraC family transcriptional regulator [Firmicutes bacterium]|nr:AraC family transcriptional regulator [Bacillota bacterium]
MSPGLSVQDAARLLGMQDASYFSRRFSRMAGMTPTAFRQAAKES